MTAVSLQCKIKNHHPEWSNVRGTISHHRPAVAMFLGMERLARTHDDELTGSNIGLQHHLHPLDDPQPAGPLGQGHGAGRHL